MGFFGKSKKEEEPKQQESPVETIQPKETQKQPEIQQQTTVQVVEQQQQQQEVELPKQETQSFDVQEILQTLKFWNHPEYIKTKDLVLKEAVVPSIQLYEQLPYKMTEFKKEYVLDGIGPQHQRHMVLGLSTILVTMASFRSGAGLRKTIRNTVLGYFGIGLFVVPEIYNSALMYHHQKKSRKE